LASSSCGFYFFFVFPVLDPFWGGYCNIIHIAYVSFQTQAWVLELFHLILFNSNLIILQFFQIHLHLVWFCILDQPKALCDQKRWFVQFIKLANWKKGLAVEVGNILHRPESFLFLIKVLWASTDVRAVISQNSILFSVIFQMIKCSGPLLC
jgi:hypothetical protein